MLNTNKTRADRQRFMSHLLAIQHIFFGIFLAYQSWRILFYNYSLEVLLYRASDIAFLFSLGAIPGVLSFSLVFLSRKLTSSQLLLLTCGLLSAGLFLFAFSQHPVMISISILCINFGFVFAYPVLNNLLLLHARQHPLISLGKLKSLGPLASIIATLLVITLQDWLSWKSFFLALAILASGCVLLAWKKFGWKSFADRNPEENKQSDSVTTPPLAHQAIIDKNLWLYYLMNFFAGSRSALFKSFILIYLIETYHFDLGHTALLVLLSSLCGFAGYRLIAFLGERHAPQHLLSWVYLLVSGLFVGFAFSDNMYLLGSFFLLDSLLFSTAVLTDVYLKQRSHDTQLTGHLATGMSIFHGAGVIIPLLGGWIWSQYGHQATFLFAALLTLTAAGFSLLLRDSTE